MGLLYLFTLSAGCGIRRLVSPATPSTPAAGPRSTASTQRRRPSSSSRSCAVGWNPTTRTCRIACLPPISNRRGSVRIVWFVERLRGMRIPCGARRVAPPGTGSSRRARRHRRRSCPAPASCRRRAATGTRRRLWVIAYIRLFDPVILLLTYDYAKRMQVW